MEFKEAIQEKCICSKRGAKKKNGMCLRCNNILKTIPEPYEILELETHKLVDDKFSLSFLG